MNQPMNLADFERLPLAWRAAVVDGLSAALDTVADAGAPERRFLRFQWFVAALIAYGGAAFTLIAESEAGPGIALPLVRIGPDWLKAAAVPGCYWPFRSFPVATGDPAAWDAVLGTLAREANALRVGPVYDDDAALVPLLAAAKRNGWAALPRKIADSFVLDIAALQAEGPWPRTSTLKKNRYHEKNLAELGTPSWEIGPADETAFAAMAGIEEASWIASRTDGADAKFTDRGHGAFWRAAGSDPVLAGMFHAALLRIGGKPAAFSFDIDAGPVKYAIANSYDPAFARSSPGKVLYYRNLSDGAAKGIRTVDWGAGDSGYKGTIGAEQGPAIRDWLFLRPGLPALVGRALAGVWARTGR